jgi:hypothetical protein
MRTPALRLPAWRPSLDWSEGLSSRSTLLYGLYTFVLFCVFLFAYATLISWYYYGERCWCYLFGDRSSIGFKVLFLIFTFLPIYLPTSIVNVSDVLGSSPMIKLLDEAKKHFDKKIKNE